MKTKSFNQKDLFNIVRGACLLSSGGGGTYSSGEKLVHYFNPNTDYYTQKDGDVFFDVVTKEDAVKDAKENGGYAVVTAYIGAPDALSGVEYPEGAVNAVKTIRDILMREGKELKYILPVEIGALSSSVACLVANKVGLPVIDADGAGRAVPELTMLTYSAENASLDHTILANADGLYMDLNIGHTGKSGDIINHYTMQHNMVETIEQLIRPTLGLQDFNEIAGIAIWVMDASKMEQAIKITGTLNKCKKLGEELEQTDNIDKIVTYISDDLGCKTYKMYEGVFVDDQCKTVTVNGFDSGEIVIQAKKNSDDTFICKFQNETLIAWDSTKSSPVAMAPDSISYYVHDEQKVYSNGDVVDGTGKFVESLSGKTVTVLGIVAEKELRQVEAKRPVRAEGTILKSFKTVLESFGYVGPYVRIEDIWGK